MHQIRDLQALEDDIRVDLAVIYSLDDPDDVTVDIDFLHLYNNLDPTKEESVNEQKKFLRSILVCSSINFYTIVIHGNLTLLVNYYVICIISINTYTRINFVLSFIFILVIYCFYQYDAPLPTEEIILKILEKVTEVKLKYSPKKASHDINLQDIIN
jgi:hypothetical protein